MTDPAGGVPVSAEERPHEHEWERGQHMAAAFGVDGRRLACAICGVPKPGVSVPTEPGAPDPDSPQWESCKVCGGDHWTSDHPRFTRCPLCGDPERVEDIVGGVCLTCADAIAFSQNARRGSIVAEAVQHLRRVIDEMGAATPQDPEA